MVKPKKKKRRKPEANTETKIQVEIKTLEENIETVKVQINKNPGGDKNPWKYRPTKTWRVKIKHLKETRTPEENKTPERK
nr:hypothetical protein [Mycoplasmopsis bovis]